MTILLHERMTRKGPVYKHHVSGADIVPTEGLVSVNARMLCGRVLSAKLTGLEEMSSLTAVVCRPCWLGWYRRRSAA